MKQNSARFSYRPALGRPLSGRGSYRAFAGVLATALLLASAFVHAATGPTYVMTIGSTSGNANGQFNAPYDVAAAPSGNIWVADTGNDRIQEFTSSGTWLRTVGSRGGGNGQFWSPQGIAVDPSGNVWVADSNNNRIEKFDAN